LGIVDLCRAISVIVESPKAPKGVYNLASIKGEAIHNLGQAVAKEVGAGVVVLPPTLTYDFMLNTDKFEETFDFRFQDTVESIIEDLRSLSPSMRKKSIFNRSTRLFKYE
jgi:nucleoside-diphosphate-sugar epimerase